MNSAKKVFLDTHFDLRTAIASMCVLGSPHAKEWHGPEWLPQDVILLIDDHPERSDFVTKRLEEVRTRFLPGYCLWVWNPEETREHMQHPFLIHLFAQQTIHQFVRHGVLYAELRAAISGYGKEKLDFSFSDACQCFCTAFGQAQKAVQQQHLPEHLGEPPPDNDPWLWESPFSLKDLFDPLKSELAPHRFPCKESVILTGKRHKPTRMLLREAGAGAILYSRPRDPADSARGFVEKAIPECRVVGFDLAGQEDEHPPHHFRTEYEQISRMHIPVTVHAGENADASFVESAILDLRARRLGHGLSLADDQLLMDRARDDGVCVELCPVSNFQTNAVFPPFEAGSGRVYPLRKFLEAGLNVCINTDNPIISNTNMVKECFQASYAYGRPGLSLWELLRILRLGFTQSFLTLPERRALVELADQIVFDLFSCDDTLIFLHSISSSNSMKTDKANTTRDS